MKTLKDLSEVQLIEFNRRSDILSSTIPFAAKLIYERDSLHKLLKEKLLVTDKWWLFVLFIIGCILDWWLRADKGFSWNLGSIIWIGLLGWYSLVQFDIYQIRKNFERVVTQINILETQCRSACPSCNLWSLREFISDDGYFDEDNEEYEKWINTRRRDILHRIQPESFDLEESFLT